MLFGHHYSLLLLALIFSLYLQCKNVTCLDYDKSKLSTEELAVVKAANSGDPDALNAIGKALLSETNKFGGKDVRQALDYFKQATNQGSAIAPANLGNIFASGTHVDLSLTEAVPWFEVAASRGHQGAMYNLGLIFAQGFKQQPPDPITALRHFHLCFLAGQPDSAHHKLSTPEVTSAAKTAHGAMSEAISTVPLFGREPLMAIWDHGSLHPVSSEAGDLWTTGVNAILEVERLFAERQGALDSLVRETMKRVVEAFSGVLETHGHELSQLQVYVLLDQIQDMLGPLAGKWEHYVGLAGRYCEALANNKYCYSSREGVGQCVFQRTNQ